MYDIFFLSYYEKNADDNFNKIKERFPFARHVKNITGLHQAHIECAKQAFTKMMYVIDGDAILEDDFNFDFNPTDNDSIDKIYVWRARNPVNDLVYGYGGVKLLPVVKVLNMNNFKVDMTTSLGARFEIKHEISNTTKFNTSPFDTWKAGFRECAKLASNVIDRSKYDENTKRLDIWCSVGREREYGEYAIRGAIEGRKWGSENIDNIENLKKINDYDWLIKKFME